MKKFREAKSKAELRASFLNRIALLRRRVRAKAASADEKFELKYLGLAYEIAFPLGDARKYRLNFIKNVIKTTQYWKPPLIEGPQ